MTDDGRSTIDDERDQHLIPNLQPPSSSRLANNQIGGHFFAAATPGCRATEGLQKQSLAANTAVGRSGSASRGMATRAPRQISNLWAENGFGAINMRISDTYR